MSDPSPIRWFVLDRLLVMIQQDAPDAASMEAAGRKIREMAAEGPFAVMTMIAASTPMPDERGRALITSIVKLANAHAVGTALVLQGEGFWAAAMRALATAVTTASGADLKVFGSAAEAYGWLAARLPAGLPSRPALDAALLSNL